MTGTWQHFPHGADVGVRGIGASVAEAFAAAACALIAAQVDLTAVQPGQPVEIVCRGSDMDDLLYVWLNTLISEMAVRRMVFARVDVAVNENRLDAVTWGEPLSVDHDQPKAASASAEMSGNPFRKLPLPVATSHSNRHTNAI